MLTRYTHHLFVKGPVPPSQFVDLIVNQKQRDQMLE